MSRRGFLLERKNLVIIGDQCHKAKSMGTRAADIAQLAWHGQFRGLYGWIARRLGVDPSYISRVARGERKAAKIERALESEIKRIARRMLK